MRASHKTISQRYQIQATELNDIRQKCIVGGGQEATYTDFITCQGVNPARPSGKEHVKCGSKVPLMRAYKCLYCGFWFCADCAEKHFGKTRSEHLEEQKQSGEYSGVLK